ncbi:RNA polymerase II transcriptional coactivator isoform X1 [Hydra vulgaris]|uniref:RNA polymerase II transcriptional coactivator isoform X1 n=1 Tax=Hydra vulgaris TaxID=6087 RepID=UPI0001927713|nr:RNA polymerase II transcriptional coactivator [Hydra vulgaris]
MSKSRVVSKEFVDSDTDSSDGENKKTKKRKVVKEVKSNDAKSNDVKSENTKSWPLSKQRRVTVDEFRGKKLISIREYYTDKNSGEEKPGKKGISLTLEQWQELVKVVEAVNEALK